MTNNYYEKLVNDAFLNVVKKTLKDFEAGEIMPVPALYLTFKTSGNSSIPETLHKQFPNEMTIVLQHQYESLIVNQDEIAVTLSFSGKKENLVIPFNSLTAFMDMDSKFSLTFIPDLAQKKNQSSTNKSKIISLKDIKKSSKK